MHWLLNYAPGLSSASSFPALFYYACWLTPITAALDFDIVIETEASIINMYHPLKRLTICIDKVGVKNNMPNLLLFLLLLKVLFGFHFISLDG